MKPADEVKNKVPQFRTWLSAAGAEVLEPTNAYEVVRFKSGEVTCVIYRNNRGGIKFVGNAEEAWKAFRSGTAWRAIPPTKHKSVSPMMRTIRARDGDFCFYCQCIVSEETESIEHLVSVTHGGPHHASNYFLAHKKCNSRAGNLSAPEKIKIHVKAVIARKTYTI